jgi:hypothetical protein
MKISGSLPAWITLDADGRVIEIEVNADPVNYRAHEAFTDDFADYPEVDLDAIETTIQNVEPWPTVIVLDDRGTRHPVGNPA